MTSIGKCCASSLFPIQTMPFYCTHPKAQFSLASDLDPNVGFNNKFDGKLGSYTWVHQISSAYHVSLTLVYIEKFKFVGFVNILLIIQHSYALLHSQKSH